MNSFNKFIKINMMVFQHFRYFFFKLLIVQDKGDNIILTVKYVLLSVWMRSEELKTPSSPLLMMSMRTGKQFSLLVLHAIENFWC